MSTTTENFLPSATGQDLGSYEQQWDGFFQDVTVYRSLNLASATISAAAEITSGTIDNTVIGASTPAAGSFTTVDATSYELNGSPLSIGDLGGSIDASQLPTPTASTLGGVKSLSAASNQFLTGIGTDGIPTRTQPSFSNLSGTASTSQLPSRTAAIWYVIDGGGSVPTTGSYGQIYIPMACTITGWAMTADASGSAVVDVLRSTYAGFPTTASIAGSDKPTLSSVQKNQNTGPLSNWGSTSLSAGDQLQFNLNSVSTCKRLNITLIVSVPYV